MRTPAFQFYPGDWLRDAELAMASASSRGIWIDALCQMWFARERGQIRGTAIELARALRCTDTEITLFIIEAQRHGFCNAVTEANGEVTLSNRRMIREEKQRESSANRQARFRQRSNNAEVTPSSASSSAFSKDQNHRNDSSVEPEKSGSPDKAWSDAPWLFEFLKNQKTFNGTRLPRLMEYPWWESLSEAVNGVDESFLTVEFAKMRTWLLDNPRRLPTERGVRRFVRDWLLRAAESRRKEKTNGYQANRR